MEQKQGSGFARVMGWAGQRKGLYMASVLLAVASVVARILPYVFVGRIVNSLIVADGRPQAYVPPLVLIVAFFALSEACHTVSTSLSHRATFEVIKNIRKQLLEKLVRMPLGRVLERGTGSIKSTMMERVDSIETSLAHLLPECTSNLLAPVLILVYLLLLDWRMALISLIPTAIGLVFAVFLFAGYGDSYQRCVDTTKALNDTAVEYVSGIEVIKAFSRTRGSYQKFVDAAQENAESFVVWMRRCAIPQAGTMTLLPYTLLTVLPFGALFVSNGSLALADFVMCVILSLGLITPLVTLGSYTDDIAAAGTIIAEIGEILDEPEIERPERTRERPHDHSVELSHVTFAYKDRDVLHDLSLRFEPDTVNALVGPSGGGKSTIARLIAGFWEPSQGEVRFGYVSARDISSEDLRGLVAYVSQDNYLFNETIRENIRQGRPTATDAEVEDIARRSGCYDFIMGLEDGFDTMVGSSGGHLSGGERQRISIARAIMKDAPIVVLDEATANVDPENEEDLLAAISALTKDKTVIMIAHRLKTVRGADKIVVIDRGKVVDSGTHEELMRRDGIYRSFVDAREHAINWQVRR